MGELDGSVSLLETKVLRMGGGDGPEIGNLEDAHFVSERTHEAPVVFLRWLAGVESSSLDVAHEFSI